MPSYRSLTRQPSWRRYLLASTVSRLPVTMAVFGMVLAGRALGSFAIGGRLAALYTLSGAANAVWRGRRLDRGDLRRGLSRDGLVVAAVAAALAVCVHVHAPWPVAGALAVVLGAALSAIPGGYRSLLPSVVPDTEVGAAYALDAVCVEACFVAGPAVAGLTAWFTGAAGVFVLLSLCAVGGAVAARRLPASDRRVPGGLRTPAPHRVPAMMALLAGTLAAGSALGIFDVGFPALAVALGTKAAVGGVIITITALGSGTAGLLLGPRIAASANLGRRAAQVLCLFGVTAIPLALAPGLAGVAVLAFVAGAPFALMTTAASVLIQRSVGVGRTAEAFSLLNAGLLAGDAIGSVVAATLLGPVGARGVLLAAAVGPLLIGGGLLAIMAAGSGTRDPGPMATRTRGRVQLLRLHRSAGTPS